MPLIYIYLYTDTHIHNYIIIIYIYIYIYIYYICINKWHVCLGSHILEQEVSRDIRKKTGGEGKEEGMKFDSY